MVSAAIAQASGNAVGSGTLWGAQGLLALFFLAAGYGHAFRSVADLAKMRAAWAADVPRARLRFIGAAEMAGAVGLVVPAATGIVPQLTWMAAAGLALIMLLAIPFHLKRKEPVAMQTVVALIAGAVAVGRLALVPFAS